MALRSLTTGFWPVFDLGGLAVLVRRRCLPPPYTVQHDAHDVRARGAQLGQALLEVLVIELPGVDHQDHCVRFRDEDRGLGNARDGRAIEHDSPVRLAERAQKPGHVCRRDVGGMPCRHTGGNELKVAVLRRGQELGRAVGGRDIAHPGRQLHPEDLVQPRLAQITIDRNHELSRRCEHPCGVGGDGRLALPRLAGGERDDRMRVLEHDVEIAAELLERLETTLIVGRSEHLGRVRIGAGQSRHLAQDRQSEPVPDLFGGDEPPNGAAAPRAANTAAMRAEGDGGHRHRLGWGSSAWSGALRCPVATERGGTRHRGSSRFTTRAAVALAYAWAAAGSVLEALMVTEFERDPRSPRSSPAPSGSWAGTSALASASMTWFSASTTIWGISI